MANYVTTDTELTGVANAIRTRGGTTAALAYPTGFSNAISAIPDTTYSLSKSGSSLTLTGTNGDSDTVSLPTSTGLSITATAAGWSSSSPYTQSIIATGVTASSNILVSPGSGLTSALYEAVCAAKMMCTAQAVNSITMTCFGDKPTINIPLTVVILA